MCLCQDGGNELAATEPIPLLSATRPLLLESWIRLHCPPAILYTALMLSRNVAALAEPHLNSG
jgi:hypothetical protein